VTADVADDIGAQQMKRNLIALNLVALVVVIAVACFDWATRNAGKLTADGNIISIVPSSADGPTSLLIYDPASAFKCVLFVSVVVFACNTVVLLKDARKR
jgi:hypothetical protein